MPVFSIEKVRDLISTSEPPCVSLYMPSHRAGPAVRQDPIRLKNGLGRAEERLLAAGRRRSEVEEFLAPARQLIDRPEFWRHQGDGFALFLSPQRFEYLRLSLKFQDLVVVGQRFHLKPLLPLLTGDGRFYILSLGQNRVRLLEASRDGARQLDTPQIPSHLEEGVNLEVKQHYHQFDLRAPRSTTERADLVEAVLEPFLQSVDTAVNDLLAGHRAPLILAGVHRICTAYRLLSKYPDIVDETVEGNPEDLEQQELHQRAWQAIKPRFYADRERAAARYLDLLGSPRAQQDLAAVLAAAVDGRVETLFVSTEENVWGSFRREASADRAEIKTTPAPDGEDLLDRTALEVLLHRGIVYAVPRAEMPGAGLLNAIYRY